MKSKNRSSKEFFTEKKRQFFQKLRKFKGVNYMNEDGSEVINSELEDLLRCAYVILARENPDLLVKGQK